MVDIFYFIPPPKSYVGIVIAVCNFFNHLANENVNIFASITVQLTTHATADVVSSVQLASNAALYLVK